MMHGRKNIKFSSFAFQIRRGLLVHNVYQIYYKRPQKTPAFARLTCLLEYRLINYTFVKNIIHLGKTSQNSTNLTLVLA